jgi:hypothetical protein
MEHILLRQLKRSRQSAERRRLAFKPAVGMDVLDMEAERR